MKIFRFIKNILLYSDTRAAVLACIVSAYAWGFFLLLPGEVLQRPYYYGLRILSSSELLWGAIFIIFGSIQLIRLIPKRANKKWIPIEYAIRFFSCLLWTYILFTAVSQYPPPPVAADTMCIVIAAWWDFLRYKGKATEAYYKKWHNTWESEE